MFRNLNNIDFDFDFDETKCDAWLLTNN